MYNTDNKNKQTMGLIFSKFTHVLNNILDEERQHETPAIVTADCKNLKRYNDSSLSLYEAESEPPAKKTKIDTVFDDISFECNKYNGKRRKYNLKITSWTVEDTDLIVNSDDQAVEYFIKENADIIALQYTRHKHIWSVDLNYLSNYNSYEVLSQPSSDTFGVAVYSKQKPINVLYGLKNSDSYNDNARVITVEYSDFYLVNVLEPALLEDNNSSKQQTISRIIWIEAFKVHVKVLDLHKPVIICGNMNVAHTNKDCGNTNCHVNDSLGCCSSTKREDINSLLSLGFVDTFRELYPKISDAYTFWRDNRDRRNNIGWRYNYFIVSQRICNCICDNVMRKAVRSSQYCPIVLYFHLSTDTWIYVRYLETGRISLKVEFTDTIETLKLHCQYLYGIPVANQQLRCGTEDLHDGKILADYKIRDGDTIDLYTREGLSFVPWGMSWEDFC